MKKFEDLISKRNSELEAENKAREARIQELNSQKQAASFKLVGSIVAALVGYNIGIVHHDGGLFTGFFMQLLFLAGCIATLVFLIQLLILLAKNVD